MQLRAGALVAIPAGWEPDRDASGESALCVGIVGDMYRLSVLERGDYQARSQEGKWPKRSIDP